MREPTDQTLPDFDASMIVDPTLAVVMLSPDGARALLGYNTKNRKVRGGRVDQYAAAIIEGRWQLSPDAICVEDGQLVNGQHRCRAIIAAGQPVPVVFMSQQGSAFDVTDNGAARTASDILFLAGLSDWPGPLATAAKLYLAETGVRSRILSDNRYIERWVIDHAELEGWVTHYEPLARQSGNPLNRLFSVPAAVLSYAIEAGKYEAVLSTPHPSRPRPPAREQIDRETVMEFGYETVTGLNLSEETDPLYVFRNQIARLLDKRDTATAVKGTMILDVMTKAWHARIQGKTPRQFRFGSVGEWPYAAREAG